MGTLRTPFADVFCTAWRCKASAALSSSQSHHGLGFDISPPSWLLEPEVQVISTKRLSFNDETGWVVLVDPVLGLRPNHTHLCWLPVEMRGPAFNSHQSMFVIASNFNHQLTIIDFEPKLAMLRGLGVVSENDCR
jgi:hypothetical protein